MQKFESFLLWNGTTFCSLHFVLQGYVINQWFPYVFRIVYQKCYQWQLRITANLVLGPTSSGAWHDCAIWSTKFRPTFLWACLLSRLCCSPFNCSIFLSILLSSIKQYQTNKTLTSLTRTQEVEDLVQPSNRGLLLQPSSRGLLLSAYVSGVFYGRQPIESGVFYRLE